MTKVHVIKDESLGGIEREYIGEYEELTMVGEIRSRKVSELTPTDIVHIDGARYRMVDRKAEVGENVIVSKSPEISLGTIGKCTVNDEFDDGSIDIDVPYDGEYYTFIDCDEDNYRVLVPVTDELLTVDTTQASPQVLDLLANLARRVTSLERQLVDTQSNVERLTQELAELKHLSQSNSDDIALLDDRTNVINAIQKFYGGAR